MRTRMIRPAAVLAALLATPALSAPDPVLEWNSIMMQTTATQNPFFQARFAAITQLAVFEAVNSITGDYDPYLGTIAASPTASTAAAATAAAHGVLRNYFPASAATLDAARAASLAAIPDGPAEAGRRCSRRSCSGGDDRAARERWVDAARVPPATLHRSGRVAANAELPAGRRRPAAVAESPAVRRGDHRSVSRRPPARCNERPLHRGLQRSETSGWRDKPVPAAGSHRCRPVLCRSLHGAGVEHGGRAGRRGAGAFVVGERACLRVAERRDQRWSRLGHGDKVLLQFLASGDRDSRRRHRRQRPHSG